MVFVEGMIGSTYLERGDDLERYQKVFSKLQSIALPPKESADFMAKLIHAYKDSLSVHLNKRVDL